MKISTKSRYGLRGLLDLAIHSGETPVSLKDIANRQGISFPYLEHSFSVLKKAGFIAGLAGSGGGYLLRMSPDKITLHMLLSVLEGEFNIVDRVPNEEETLLQRCIRENVWDQINQDVSEMAATTTLQDMIDGRIATT